ncbi:Rpp20 subunit of nuclear RNase MRP and P-domain-containing protein [Aspergillus pseudoustus]|uniref:Rpp20 subunit of nuclear RNase MRP and P-domain-containing protein n=1 Tax=Aspergillus pseudoustus TaxID=1810923 RepID=A0ABR4IM09_9EURO
MPQSKRSKTARHDAKTDMSTLNFERKNQHMVKLPKSAKIHKRPIPHPATASPYAGSSTPKTVYVSSSTPYMAAVKRVQKLLRHAEKRATAAVEASFNGNKHRGRSGGRSSGATEKLVAALAKGEGQKDISNEEVFIKATGKAIETAMRAAKWFESSGREAEYSVKVETGSVLVVDDVEEGEGDEVGNPGGPEADAENGVGLIANGAGVGAGAGADSKGKSDDTTMLTETTTNVGNTTIISEKSGNNPTPPISDAKSNLLSKNQKKKRKRAATLAAQFAETELPETRTRWVNSVQVAISLK